MNDDWKAFEQEIANVYRELGAHEVQLDKNIAGNQVDVFAIVPRVDGTTSRDIISCKYYNKNVGIKDVKDWHQVFQICRQAGEADQAVIATNVGFTRQAQECAQRVGIHLRTLDQLRWANVDLRPYVDEELERLSASPLFSRSIYAPLRFTLDNDSREISEASLLETFLSRSDCPLLTILGDFGAGKTTFSQHVFLSLARRWRDGDTSTRIPVYLNLREYPGHLNVPGFIQEVLVNQHNARCPNYAKFRHLLESGYILLIFDAFDEMISRNNYDDTLRNLRAVVDVLHGDAKALLTCRTHYFKSPEEVHDTHRGTELFRLMKTNEYEIAYVQPFIEADIERVVRATCRDSTTALAQIRSTYDLMGLARRPILLQMIMEVLEDIGNSEDPVNSAQLYSKYVSQWLQRDDWRVRLERAFRRSFTMIFATEMYIREQRQFTLDEVRAAIRRHFVGTNQSLLADYENDIRVCSFIRRDDDRFEFVHWSLVEYFTAQQLYHDIVGGDSERLGETVFGREVLSFLAQQLPTTETLENLRKWLSNVKGNSTLARNTLELLAVWSKNRLTGAIHGLRIADFANQKTCLENCQLIDVHATDIYWESINWQRVTSSAGRWEKCEWNSPTFDSVTFIQDRFRDIDIHDGDWQSVLWDRCKISVATFLNECANEVVFESCDLERCELGNLNGVVRVNRCDLKSCTMGFIVEITASTVRDGSISNCSLRRADLKGTRFIGVRFEGVDFSVECLEGVVFEKCVFTRTTFDFSGTQQIEPPPEFRGCTGIPKSTMQQLQQLSIRDVK